MDMARWTIIIALFLAIYAIGLSSGDYKKRRRRKINVALHGQVKPTHTMVVGSAVTTQGLANSLKQRKEIDRVDIFYSDDYNGLFDFEYDLLLIEGWVPGLHELLQLTRLQSPDLITIYYCLDLAYPGLEKILALPVDGIATNSALVLEVLQRVGREALLLPLAADTEVFRPMFDPSLYHEEQLINADASSSLQGEVQHTEIGRHTAGGFFSSLLPHNVTQGRDLPFVYVGAGGAMLSEKPLLKEIILTAASIAETHVWGNAWEALPPLLPPGGLANYPLLFLHGVLPPGDLPIVYARARAILSATISAQEVLGMVNNRIFEGMAAGGLVLAQRSTILEALFPTELLYFSSLSELSALLRGVMRGEYEERRALARGAVQGGHRYAHRLPPLLAFYHHLRGLRGEREELGQGGGGEREMTTEEVQGVIGGLLGGVKVGGLPLLPPSLDLSLLYPAPSPAPLSPLHRNRCLLREGRGEGHGRRALVVSPSPSSPPAAASSLLRLDLRQLLRSARRGLQRGGYCVDMWTEREYLSLLSPCLSPVSSSACLSLLRSYDLLLVVAFDPPPGALHPLDALTRLLPPMLTPRSLLQRHLILPLLPLPAAYPSPPLDLSYEVVLCRGGQDLAGLLRGGEHMEKKGGRGRREEEEKEGEGEGELLRFQFFYGLDPSLLPPSDPPPSPLSSSPSLLVVCFSWALSFCSRERREGEIALGGEGGAGEAYHLLLVVEEEEGGAEKGLLPSLSHPPEHTSLLYLGLDNLNVFSHLLSLLSSPSPPSSSPLSPLVVFLNPPQEPRASSLAFLSLCYYYGARIHLSSPDDFLLRSAQGRGLGDQLARGGEGGEGGLRQGLQRAWGLPPRGSSALLTPLTGREGLLLPFLPLSGGRFSYALWGVELGGGFEMGRDGRLCLYLRHGNTLLDRCLLRSFHFVLLFFSEGEEEKEGEREVKGTVSLRGNIFSHTAFERDFSSPLYPLPSREEMLERADERDRGVKDAVFFLSL